MQGSSITLGSRSRGECHELWMSVTGRERGERVNVASECLRICTPKTYRNTLSIWWVDWFGGAWFPGHLRSDRWSRKYVADENASVLTNSIYLSLSLLCHCFLITVFGGFQTFQHTASSSDQTLEDTDCEDGGCSTEKLPILHIMVYLWRHRRWFCFRRKDLLQCEDLITFKKHLSKTRKPLMSAAPVLMLTLTVSVSFIMVL